MAQAHKPDIESIKAASTAAAVAATVYEQTRKCALAIKMYCHL